MWKPSKTLMSTVTHYSSFPATGVSLRQMVQFGQNPSQGKWWLFMLEETWKASLLTVFFVYG
jgi:hypothetical protein